MSLLVSDNQSCPNRIQITDCPGPNTHRAGDGPFSVLPPVWPPCYEGGKGRDSPQGQRSSDKTTPSKAYTLIVKETGQQQALQRNILAEPNSKGRGANYLKRIQRGEQIANKAAWNRMERMLCSLRWTLLPICLGTGRSSSPPMSVTNTNFLQEAKVPEFTARLLGPFSCILLEV